MKLPNYAHAIVPKAKITEYLLSSTHPSGRIKAKFFTQLGFSSNAWEEFATALRQHAAEHQVAKTEASPFGMRYVIEGIVHTPIGKTPVVRTVWFIEIGESSPRFVTAYPLRRESS